MYTLNFDASTPESKERFDLIYEAFAFSSRPMKGADVRICAKIFDKLETLGQFTEEKGGRRIFIFDGEGGRIQLENVEYSLLKETLDFVEWNAYGARKAAPVMEWLASLKEDGIKLEK
jgi:hypothetical protein